MQTRIDALGCNEHGVILDMVQRAGVPCAQNTNGHFFDLTTVPQELLESMEKFVAFSVDNNKSLALHDRCMHDQLKLLQRIPAAQIGRPPTPKRAPKATAPVQQQQQPQPNAPPEALPKSARLAFVRRASDAPTRRRAEDDVLETPEPAVLLNRGRRDF